MERQEDPDSCRRQADVWTAVVPRTGLFPGKEEPPAGDGTALVTLLDSAGQEPSSTLQSRERLEPRQSFLPGDFHQQEGVRLRGG